MVSPQQKLPIFAVRTFSITEAVLKLVDHLPLPPKVGITNTSHDAQPYLINTSPTFHYDGSPLCSYV